MANRPLRVLVVLVTLLQMDVLQGTEAQNSTTSSPTTVSPNANATWAPPSSNTTASSPTTVPPNANVTWAPPSSNTTTSSPTTVAPPVNVTWAPPSTYSPVPTTSPANEIIYPYGTAAGDLQDNRHYNDWRCIQFFIGVRGFPFYGKRHYKLHVCRNGLISFEEPWYRRWPYNFGQYWFDGQPLLAPYWSLVDKRDAFREGTSKLYFQIYQKGDGKPSTTNILRRAAEDVNKHCRDHKLPTEFSEASWVMVVTWVNIRHWYSRWQSNLRDLYNTFQAVLITNGVHSFVMYNYPRNGIQWSAPDYSYNYDRYWNARGLPVVGINTGDYNRLYYNNPRSGRVSIVDIDDLKGVNIFKSRYSNFFESFSNGMRGRIFIRLEDSQGEDQARLQCINWYYSQNYVNWYLRSLEPCPCTYWQAWRDRRFRWSSWNWPRYCFYSTFPSSHGWGQECCYVFSRQSNWWWGWSWSSYMALGNPDGGTPHRYHKYYYPSAHYSDDANAYQQCYSIATCVGCSTNVDHQTRAGDTFLYDGVI